MKFERDSGIASVEFVVVAALLLVPLFTIMIDVGRMIDAGQVLSRAAREAAVQASREGDTAFPRARAAAARTIEAGGLNPDMASIAVEGSVASSSPVNIYIVYSLDGFAIFPVRALLPDSLAARATASHS